MKNKFFYDYDFLANHFENFTECYLDEASLADYSARGATNCQAIDENSAWEMIITCPSGLLWSETWSPDFTIHCSCNGGKWPNLSGQCQGINK